MATGSRKRRHFVVVSTLSALVVVLVWIHGEVVTVKLVEATRTYLDNGVAVVHQEQQPRHNETTANVTADDDDAVGGSNNTSVVMNAMNESTPNNNNNNNNNTQLTHKRISNATIIVFLSGEMGNHLSILAKALSVQLLAQQYNITAYLVFRHQSHSKWTRARDDVQRCFPKLREYDFEAANTDAFDQFAREQQQQLVQGGWDPSRLKLDSDQDDKVSIEEALAYWKSILDSPSLSTVEIDAAGLSFPFLSVASWCPLGMLDQYLDEIRDFFEFDKAACCRIRPAADESVFHLRNFLVEMPRVGKRKGYEELSPNKIAWELFGHLNPSDKIAVATRFGGDNVAPYVSALEERGLQVRVIQNQTGTEDFCFLMSARKELVGSLLSTYVDWAAYLGDTKRVNLYRVLSPNTRARSFPLFNWTHPKLKDRVYAKVYKSEEYEEWEANEMDAGKNATLSRVD